MNNALSSVQGYLKNTLVQRVIISLIVILIAYLVYRRLSTKKFDPAKLPAGGKELPDSWIQSGKYKDYAARMWNQIGGLSLGKFTTEALCQEILGLTDEQIITINNYYNSLYGKADGETMLEKLKGEWFNLPNTNKLIDKLITLNLR